MKGYPYTVEQIWSVLKRIREGEGHTKVCGELGIPTSTAYSWRRLYRGLDEEGIRRVKPNKESTYYKRCKLHPGDVALVIAGKGGIPFKRVVVLDHIREGRTSRYRTRYLNGPRQGLIRTFAPQDLVLESKYLEEVKEAV